MSNTGQPPEKPTVKLDAVPDWAVKMTDRILSELGKTNANIALVSSDMGIVKERLGLVEDRTRKLEQGPSIPPPPPITSERVRALVAHPSQMDLDLQAAQAAQIIKDAERDRKIEETHALAAAAAQVLQEQSDYMGMGKRGAQWLVSKEGRTALAQLAVAIIGIYETLKHTGAIK